MSDEPMFEPRPEAVVLAQKIRTAPTVYPINLVDILSRALNEAEARGKAELEKLGALLEDAHQQIGSLKEQLRCADAVVSYLVIWGAQPSERLTELVAERMRQRVKARETLCLPWAVEDALKQEGP